MDNTGEQVLFKTCLPSHATNNTITSATYHQQTAGVKFSWIPAPQPSDLAPQRTDLPPRTWNPHLLCASWNYWSDQRRPAKTNFMWHGRPSATTRMQKNLRAAGALPSTVLPLIAGGKGLPLPKNPKPRLSGFLASLHSLWSQSPLKHPGYTTETHHLLTAG